MSAGGVAGRAGPAATLRHVSRVRVPSATMNAASSTCGVRQYNSTIGTSGTGGTGATCGAAVTGVAGAAGSTGVAGGAAVAGGRGGTGSHPILSLPSACQRSQHTSMLARLIRACFTASFPRVCARWDVLGIDTAQCEMGPIHRTKSSWFVRVYTVCRGTSCNLHGPSTHVPGPMVALKFTT